MGRLICKRFQLVLICLLVFSQSLWASQPAVVIVEKAVVYADAQMSAAVGFIRKGKRIKIGKNSRNHSQVYPLVVSGRVAYIKVNDVSTETQSAGSKELVAERFKKNTQQDFKSNYSAYVFSYASQITLANPNGNLKNSSSVDWTGAGISGSAQLNSHWDLDIMLNYMNAKIQTEEFQAIEFGAGSSYRLIEIGRFQTKIGAYFKAIPFANYSLGDLFRVNGFGFGTGANAKMIYRLGKHFGIEGAAGFDYTKITGLKAPKPYKEMSPSFIGSRLAVGLNYQF